jgi:endonuclease/exonuclease/phosphatase family metal-dependent hydrolase
VLGFGQHLPEKGNAMRLASFNVENLFNRASVMNLDDWNEGRPVLDAVATLTDLLEQPVYSAADKTLIITLLTALGLSASDTGPYVILRRNRGSLVARRNSGLEVVADGRDDWIGWVELRKAAVNETAMLNTGRVIRDMDADILAVVEAEDRIALSHFSTQVLGAVGGAPYPNIMLIDGNDARGIDVGLMTKAGYDIGAMRSHVADGGPDAPIFSRDCPEYAVTTPGGEVIWVLVNHFKSKGFGSPADNNRRRRAQAQAVAGYVARLQAEGFANIAVMGDLNDTPDSTPLAPLFQAGLRDVSEHPTFDTGDFAGQGTYALGNDDDKIDYILLTQPLFDRITAAGLFRMGAWPGSRPKRWPVYPELQRKIHAASDHHAIWVDIA